LTQPQRRQVPSLSDRSWTPHGVAGEQEIHDRGGDQQRGNPMPEAGKTASTESKPLTLPASNMIASAPAAAMQH
jgi:hypothetical protein